MVFGSRYEELLHKAAEAGDKAEVERLVDKGAAVDVKNKEGDTPLHLASWKGHIDVVEFLIAKGANVNAKSDNRKTSLHLASWGGHIDVVKLLIAKAANVNAKNNNRETPLHKASWWGHIDVVELLIAKGAIMNVKNNWQVGLMPARSHHLSSSFFFFASRQKRGQMDRPCGAGAVHPLQSSGASPICCGIPFNTNCSCPKTFRRHRQTSNVCANADGLETLSSHFSLIRSRLQNIHRLQ
jgi:hypothetical protein